MNFNPTPLNMENTDEVLDTSTALHHTIFHKPASIKTDQLKFNPQIIKNQVVPGAEE